MASIQVMRFCNLTCCGVSGFSGMGIVEWWKWNGGMVEWWNRCSCCIKYIFGAELHQSSGRNLYHGGMKFWHEWYL